MKSISKFVAAVTSGFFALSGVAFAAPQMNVPEPGSIALVGVAIAALVIVARKRKK